MIDLPISKIAFSNWKNDQVTKLFFEACQLDIDIRVHDISERIRSGTVPNLEHQQRIAMCAELLGRIKEMSYDNIQQIFEDNKSLKEE